MLLLLALLAAVLSNGGSNSITRSQENDELFDVLDKELDEFLEKAIDDLPRKLGDTELQRIEGSGEPGFVSETFTQDSESNTALTSPTINQTISEKSREEMAQSQMLSSLASNAQIPLKPQLTSKVLETVVNEVADAELRRLVAHMVTELPQSQSVLTSNLYSTTPPAGELVATTPTTTTSEIIDNTSPIASATTTYSTTPLPISTRQFSLPAGIVPRETNIIISKIVRQTSRTWTGCKEEATCYDDTDCGQGRCLGVSLGRCNCHACIANVECMEDSDCGGLRTACRDGICKCAKALSTHGYTLYIDALTRFCSQQECTEDSDSCFGLPCSRGICSCT